MDDVAIHLARDDVRTALTYLMAELNYEYGHDDWHTVTDAPRLERICAALRDAVTAEAVDALEAEAVDALEANIHERGALYELDVAWKRLLKLLDNVDGHLSVRLQAAVQVIAHKQEQTMRAAQDGCW
jgi:hypothetical protein